MNIILARHRLTADKREIRLVKILVCDNFYYYSSQKSVQYHYSQGKIEFDNWDLHV